VMSDTYHLFRDFFHQLLHVFELRGNLVLISAAVAAQREVELVRLVVDVGGPVLRYLHPRRPYSAVGRILLCHRVMPWAWGRGQAVRELGSRPKTCCPRTCCLRQAESTAVLAFQRKGIPGRWREDKLKHNSSHGDVWEIS